MEDKFISDENRIKLLDNSKELLKQLCKIGVIITEAIPDFKEDILQYKITVPEHSFQFSNPVDNALKAKEILLDNAKAFGIDTNNIKVMFNIRLDEYWTEERYNNIASNIDECLDELMKNKLNI